MQSHHHLLAGTGDRPFSLSPAFSGAHAWCNEKMRHGDQLDNGVSLGEFFENGGFDAAISTYGRFCASDDRRAVASMWSLYYFSALTIPFILARVLAGQLLPVSFETMRISLADDGLPRAFGVSDAGDWSGEPASDAFTVIAPLIEEHLSKVVTQLKSRAGISTRLGWNNAAVYIDYALRGLEPWSGEPADKPLLNGRVLPDGKANPFNDCLRYEEEDGLSVCRRKLCCLRYLLPGIPSCGSLCALPAQRTLSS